MPVNRAARHARRLGDVFQRSAAHSTFVKHLAGGVDNLLAGALRRFFGLASHALFSWLKLNQ